MDHQRDRRGRQADRDQRETGDRSLMALQVAEGRIIGGIKQHGSDEQSQRKLGIQAQAYVDGSDGNAGSCQCQQRGIRQPQRARYGQQHDRCSQHHQDGREDDY